MGSYSLSSSSHPLILYTIILVLAGYVATDLLRNQYGGEPSESVAVRSSWRSEGGVGPAELKPEQPEICNTVEGHMEEDLEEELTQQNGAAAAENPWRQIKWVGKAARCRVNGHLIERLDTSYNFRRGFALRFTPDVEDKTHLLPWMLGSRVDLNARKRRILLDLGAAAFSSSVAWFLRLYPCDFTEIHAFDPDPNLLKLPEAAADENKNYAAPNEWAQVLKTAAALPAWMLRRINLHYRFVSDFDDTESHAINITRFIVEELRPRAGVDALVVKMDIEGSEWDILRRWMADPWMRSVVDELFVEVHYDHPSMHGYHWARFAPTKRADALRLLAELRHSGVYAHPWP